MSDPTWKTPAFPLGGQHPLMLNVTLPLPQGGSRLLQLTLDMSQAHRPAIPAQVRFALLMIYVLMAYTQLSSSAHFPVTFSSMCRGAVHRNHSLSAVEQTVTASSGRGQDMHAS